MIPWIRSRALLQCYETQLREGQKLYSISFPLPISI